MATIKFSDLPNLTTITTGTIIPVVSAGNNYTVNTASLSQFATSGNITPASVSATGNITGSYIFGNGSQLTGLPALYGNANVAAYLPTYTGAMTALTGNVTTTANISGSYILGNGSQLTGLPSQYSNANVAAYLPTYSGDITANVISTTGNVTSANFRTVGIVSATGNVTGNYFIGNGSQLTGIATTGNYVDLTTNQSVAGNKTFTGTTTLYPYVEYTNVSGLTTGGSFTPTQSNGTVQKVTATASFALNAPTGMTTGQSITLIIRQDGTGSRTMTPSSVYKFAYGSKTLSTAANAIDMLSIFYDGTNYLCNLVKGYV